MRNNYEKRLNSINSNTPQKMIDNLFEELYAEYSGLLGFILTSYKLSIDEIKDIINDSFFKLYLNHNNVKNIKYFLITCAKNQVKNELNRKAKLLNLDDYIDYFSTSDLVENIDRKLAVENIKKSLSKEDCEIFDLYVIQGLTSKEVSETLRVKESTIRVRWHRIQRKLRK